MDDARTDESLMLAYRDGEAAAFEALYARHRGKLFRYLLHQCRKREQAEEMFQEVWMSVIRARSAYEVSAKFSTWLYRIAHNRLIDGYRATGHLAEFEREIDDEDGELPEIRAPEFEQPEQRMERGELAACMIAAVEALPAAQREAFLLVAEGGLSVDEIARAIGVGFETAKSRLRYAYARLRASLGDLS
ncbi:MAG TPA: RNA polymerase sigma factor [Rhodocyclaceae bacterium]|nr:RNA polymerase sigma factor [Rhodocyclaceae bacterium]